MLDVAIRHREELIERFRAVWFDEKYKYWNCTNYYEEWDVVESTWNRHQFVSLGKQGKMIGYIGYHIDRANDFVYGLNIINFTDNKITFGLDGGQAIKDIFEKYHFRKINFSVVVGNPIEKTYDRMIERYGGTFCGYQRRNVKLIDGQFYDEKLYEIFDDEYRRKVRYGSNM